jgi:AraC-like DNA-binding protein
MAKPRWENAFSLIDPQINAEGLHVWPFDLTFPLDVRFYRWDKRHHIRPNRHEYFELFYLQQGELICRIQERELPMQSGDLAVISSTHYHTLRWPEKNKHTGLVKAAALYFLPDLLRATDATGEEAEYLLPFLMQGTDFPHIVSSKTGIPGQVIDLIKRTYSELPANTARARLTVKTYLKMILILLVNHYADQQGTVETFNRKQQAIERLSPLFAFLETHFAQPIPVTTAAEIVNMSESHFMRFFKQVTAQSFTNYLNHFRLAKAEELLTKTDLTVAQISQAVGFCDQSYFGAIFRKVTGHSPLQYRHQRRTQ